MAHGVWLYVCEIRVGYTYLVAAWNNFYNYKFPLLLAFYPTLVVKASL
jgi:hypothetical protein